MTLVDGRRLCVLTSGGDDGALAAHCLHLSIKRVVARGNQALAHAAQITGACSPRPRDVPWLRVKLDPISGHVILRQ